MVCPQSVCYWPPGNGRRIRNKTQLERHLASHPSALGLHHFSFSVARRLLELGPALQAHPPDQQTVQLSIEPETGGRKRVSAKARWRVSKVVTAWVRECGLEREAAGLRFLCGGAVLRGTERVGELPDTTVTVAWVEEEKKSSEVAGEEQREEEGEGDEHEVESDESDHEEDRSGGMAQDSIIDEDELTDASDMLLEEVLDDEEEDDAIELDTVEEEKSEKSIE